MTQTLLTNIGQHRVHFQSVPQLDAAPGAECEYCDQVGQNVECQSYFLVGMRTPQLRQSCLNCLPAVIQYDQPESDVVVEVPARARRA